MPNRQNVALSLETKERFEKLRRERAEEIYKAYSSTNQDSAERLLLDFWDENHEESK